MPPPRSVTKYSELNHGNGPFQHWVEPSPQGEYFARCKYCQKCFALGSMGNSALTSHDKGMKHKQKLSAARNTPSVLGFARPSAVPQPVSDGQSPEAPTIPSVSVPPVSTTSNRTITQFMHSSEHVDNVTRAETMWTVHTVMNNNSFHSNSSINKVFLAMFHDSAIAKKFKLGETKTKYYLEHGLQVHFRDLLLKKLENNTVSKYFVVCFDETLNENLQEKQLDMYLRFWDCDKVITRYIHSEFLGKAQATHLVSCFENLNKIQSLKHLVQVSMDGPNVNIKAHRELNEISRNMYDHELLTIGTCPLHQVHNSLKAAMDPPKGSEEKSFNIGEFLSSLYKLFHDAPARREEYTKVTESYVFPQSFALHRWADNLRAAERGVEMLNPLKVFCKAVDNKKKGVTKIDTQKYKIVRDFVNSKFARVKLLFFIDMCESIEHFLVTFQCDRPMVPFVVKEIYAIVRMVQQRFLVDTYCAKFEDNPMKAKVRDIQYYLTPQKIDLGRNANKFLNDQVEASEITPKQVEGIKIDCRHGMIRFVEKIQNKSPADFTLALNMDCMDPVLITKKPKVAVEHFEKVTECFSDANLLSEVTLGKACRQFKNFVHNHKGNTKFKQFKFAEAEYRVDTLFYNALYNQKEFMELWEVSKILLVISHGQASVERGFSINKHASTANQSEGSLVARRIVRDHINYLGGLDNFTVTQPLTVTMKGACRRYKEQQADKKKEQERNVKQSEKDKVQEEIDDKKKTIQATENNIADYNEQLYKHNISVSRRHASEIDCRQALQFITGLFKLKKEAEDYLKKLNEDLCELQRTYKNV